MAAATLGRLLRPQLVRLLERVRTGDVTFAWESGPPSRFGAPRIVGSDGERAPRSAVVRWSDRATYRTLRHGTLGFGDAYVDGDWAILDGALLDFVRPLVAARLNQPLKEEASLAMRAALAVAGAVARATPHRSVRAHYEAPRDFFALWLDEELTYTCGYARSPTDDLATMQRNKLALVCERLDLREGQTLLDLGCGWGSLALFAAEEKRARVTAVNVSRAQLDRLAAEARRRRLDEAIVTRLEDARHVAGARFDRVAAVGVAEHMGRGGLDALFAAIARSLAPGGVALVHTIGSSVGGGTDPWIERRIFPGSYVPSLSELAASAERARLRVCQVEDLGPHYALTLAAWLGRFSSRRSEIAARWGERFARTWELYLALLVPTFEELSTCLYQMVLTPGERARPGLRLVTTGGYPDAERASAATALGGTALVDTRTGHV